MVLLALGCWSAARSGMPAAPGVPGGEPGADPPAVVVEGLTGLPIGTPVSVVSVRTEEGAYADALPVGVRVRSPAGEVEVPASAVAIPRPGRSVEGAGGAAGRAWLAEATFLAESPDDVYPLGVDAYVIGEHGGRYWRTSPVRSGGCSGEILSGARWVDFTSDGRPELLVTRDSYVCEAGGDGSALDVYGVDARGPQLLLSVQVPRYPGVGRVAVGHIWWSAGSAPATIRAVTIAPREADGIDAGLVRTEQAWTWERGRTVAGPVTTGPVRGDVDGEPVTVTVASAGAGTITVVDADGTMREVDAERVHLDDAFFAAELDGAGALSGVEGVAPGPAPPFVDPSPRRPRRSRADLRTSPG